MTTIRFLLRRLALTAGTLLCASAALAANPYAEAQARYQQEMARCNSGQSNQDPVTCRTEARNALAEARRGGLTAAAPAQYESNALQRCNAFQGDDRMACEARMRGDAKIDGSVGAGGILREGVIVIPAK